jgi:hypothetical protein
VDTVEIADKLNITTNTNPISSHPITKDNFFSSTIVADTAATSHFFEKPMDLVHTNMPIQNVIPAKHGIKVLLPNNSILTSTHTANLTIPNLPPAAQTVHIFPKLASGSLLSIGQLCDHGCTATFNKDKLYVYYNGKIILQGSRQASKLWTIDNTPTHSLNAAVDTPTIADRIKFYHASLFSPALDTLRKAIKAGYLTSFPTFTAQQLSKTPPKSEAMTKGHLNAQRANLRSTKRNHKTPFYLFNATAHSSPPPTLIEPDPDDTPTTTPISLPPVPPPSPQPQTTKDITLPIITQPQDVAPIIPNTTPQQRTHYIYPACTNITGQIHTDQTGQFTVPSISGNKYLLILYDYDSNYIHAEPLPSRTKHQLKKAFITATTKLKLRGLTPKLQRLDNEASKLLLDHMDNEGIDYQLTPAGLHRRNSAEKAVQTFKNHFIAGLCSTNPNFPLNLWDKLLPQAMLTLNLLRPSRINPQLSAQAQVHGAFDYNRTPLAPPGIKVLAHVRPEARKTWAPHADDGFYLGPAMHHYRCHRIWMTKTAAERIVQTVKWLPHNSITMPTATRESTIIAAANDLTAAIKQQDNNPLLPPVTTQTRTILKHLDDIFNNSNKNYESNAQKQSAAQQGPPTTEHTTTQPRVPPRGTQPRVLPTYTPAQVTPTVTPTGQPTLPNTIPLQIPPVPTQTPRAEPPQHNLRRSKRLLTIQPPQYTDHVLNAVLNKNNGQLEEYRHLIKGPDKHKWLDACSKEFARLTNGRQSDNTPGTNTIEWMHPKDLPSNKTPTYMRVCANYRPQKSDPYRVRCTVGGNLIKYPGPTYSPTADLTTFKLFLNSVISTPNAKFMDMDIKDFYLCSTMPEPEYMLVPYSLFPPDIIKEYNIDKLVRNGMVLAKVIKGMYGLPQAGRLAYDQLKQHLALGGYLPAPHTPGLFRHTNSNLQFILVVDDFGVKFTSIADAKHLLHHLQKKYTITTDWEGKLFCGVNLEWDYNKRTVAISMPNYVNKAIKRFQHPLPTKPQHSPHQWTPPKYGAKTQFTTTPEPFQALTAKEKLYCQEVIGVFLYYARAIDPTMLTAVGSIASNLANEPFSTLSKKINQLFDYASTHPNATIKYIASQMHLWSHSDASYLCETKARSRAGGFHFLSNPPNLPISPDDKPPPLNGPVHVLCKIIDAVMSSAQEAETGAGYLNARDMVPLRQTLIELGHPQGPTPLQFDNKCATGLMNDTLRQKRSKAMDMRFYWLRDRVRQKQFHIHWKKGSSNLGDYVTKHHPTKHHQDVRPTYVCNFSTQLPLQSKLQGCANSVISQLYCKAKLVVNPLAQNSQSRIHDSISANRQITKYTNKAHKFNNIS